MSSQNGVDSFEIRPESGLGGRWPIRWRPWTSVEGRTRFWPSGFRVHPIRPFLRNKPHDAIHTVTVTNRILVRQTIFFKSEISLSTYQIHSIPVHIIIILYTYVRHIINVKMCSTCTCSEHLPKILLYARRHHTRGMRRLAGS